MAGRGRDGRAAPAVADRHRASEQAAIRTGRGKWVAPSEMLELGIRAGGDEAAKVDIGDEPPVP